MNEETASIQPQGQAVDVPQPTEGQVDAAIDSALNEAVASVVDAGKNGGGGQDGDAGKNGGAQDGAKEPAPKVENPPPAPNEPPEVDYSEEQALFERGVKAGIAVKDLLNVPTRDLAEKMVALAEKAIGISSNKTKEGDAAGSPDDDFGSAIEEMEKDGEYDPKILRVLKGLYKENQTLKKAGKTAVEHDFFEGQFGSLDAGLRSHMNAVHKSQLKSKFDLLEAGYRAQGSHIQREDIFREAAKLALGDLMNRQAEERKATALEQRSNLRLARPGGENGQYRRGKGPATEEDIASELWAQITGN